MNSLTTKSKILSKKLEIASLKAEKALLKDKLAEKKAWSKLSKKKKSATSIV